jgi:hypothetical protein
MSLSASLKSPLSLFRKLEREAYRAYHAGTALQKADHFYNFCVTAASMRDYMLEHLGKVLPADKRPYHAAWSRVPALQAAAEIANSAKHFVLREPKTGTIKPVKTRSVQSARSRFVDVYASEDGEIKAVKARHPDIKVTMSDGTTILLHSFTREVLQYWKTYLAAHGLQVRRQPFAQLAGK